MSDELVQCPKCAGDGKVFSGYYGHPETSDGGPIYHRCSLCKGSRVVTDTEETKYVCGRIIDPY